MTQQFDYIIEWPFVPKTQDINCLRDVWEVIIFFLNN